MVIQYKVETRTLINIRNNFNKIGDMFDHGEGVVGVERFTGRFKGSQIARIVSSFVSFIRFETDRIDGYWKTLMIHRKIGVSVIRW